MRMLLAASLVVSVAAPAVQGQKPTQGPDVSASRCARLAGAATDRLKILSATLVPAGVFVAAPGRSFRVPASCRVSAIARPTPASQIGIELWLPVAWSGRYVQLGNGGFAGNIDRPSLANEIRRGNAGAMTDTGHKADEFDASWAFGHPDKVLDYGYRSIKATSDAANDLIRSYYQRPANHRYFVGCSNGGRQALMAAQKYPGDWDGILAGSPAVAWTHQLATFAAIQHQLRSDPGNWIPAEKLPAIQRAAVAACPENASHGLKCGLDVKNLLCRGQRSRDCLTAAQAASLDLIQSGASPTYYGFAPTAAAIPDNWDKWILNVDRRSPSELTFATQAFRYLILDQPDWQVERFDVVRDFERASNRTIAGRRLSEILDADNPDLSTFERRGGKLILYVGWADAVISPAASVAYYRRVARLLGEANTRRFARLFVVPGMQHCQGGLAPNSFGQAWLAPALRPDSGHDIRLALEAWVEHSRAPRTLTAARYDGDQGGAGFITTQQLRPYPAPSRAIRRVRP
jgi:feruloyl esterase